MDNGGKGIIRLSQVSKIFPSGIRALEDISFDIRTSDFVSIVGPSGCGKSTLLRLIAQLEKPSAGKLEIDLPAAESRVPVSFVFQDPTLLPWRTILKNTILPLEMNGEPKTQSLERAHEVLKMVGLDEFSHAYPNQLSGGMKMRASLARALITKPKLLLLDEPFGALDEVSRLRLDLELRELWRKLGITIVFVTHSLSEALFLSNRILILSSRPGKMIKDFLTPLGPDRDRNTRTSGIFIRELETLGKTMEELG